MKWIIITTPTFISHEAKYIDQLFEAGIDLLHLRKPDSAEYHKLDHSVRLSLQMKETHGH